MATLNSVKNRIRTLGLTGEDDEVKGDSPMAAAARAKGLDKYDMSAGTYSGPGQAISNAIRAVRGDLGKEADSRKEMGAKAAREADAEMKREMRGTQKPANFDAIEEARQDAKDAAARKKISEMGYAGGGKVSSASKRADGCAIKGKTKGTMVKMNYGGKC
jgi:hypothetical protein